MADPARPCPPLSPCRGRRAQARTGRLAAVPSSLGYSPRVFHRSPRSSCRRPGASFRRPRASCVYTLWKNHVRGTIKPRVWYERTTYVKRKNHVRGFSTGSPPGRAVGVPGLSDIPSGRPGWGGASAFRRRPRVQGKSALFCECASFCRIYFLFLQLNPEKLKHYSFN